MCLEETSSHIGGRRNNRKKQFMFRFGSPWSLGWDAAARARKAASAIKTVTQDNVDDMSPSHSKGHKITDYNWLLFLGPALFYKFTDVTPIYYIAITRFVVIHLILSLHYKFVDFDNYLNKLSQKQILREKDDYCTAFYLHMWSQVALQLMFPGMFFSPNSEIGQCCLEAFVMHVVLVEPLYYFVHRWLHVPKQMKAMHGFHHLSINTLPTTALVQNFEEHFVYIATFGPAFLLPFFVQGRQHWVAIGAYLVSFDIVNTFGHTNICIRNALFTHKYSPLTYLFYTPEFHLGHHAYFNANYSLFMPIWDKLFGSYREYKMKNTQMLPADQQNFVFIGHNGGLGHLMTIPELCLYNVYDKYKQFLPLRLEIMIMHLIGRITHLFISFYYCSRFCIANEYIGRIICLCRTPWDYMHPNTYPTINKEMIDLIKREYKAHGTRYFGLGNLNKMKQLNEGGVEIAKMIEEDEFLKDKKIRVWTGDTMTVASVYNQILDIPNLTELFYIGAGGKVGTAVCKKLVETKPKLKIRIFSKNHILNHPNISYSCDLSEIRNYQVALVGKILSEKMYAQAFSGGKACKTRYILDYTVPKMTIEAVERRPENIQHIRIGLLKTDLPKNPFLKGHYDVCMSHPEHHIVPCHFGCILNTVLQEEQNEVGEIDPNRVDKMWKMTRARGFENISIDYSKL